MDEDVPAAGYNFQLIGRPVGDRSTIVMLTKPGVETVVRDASGEHRLLAKAPYLSPANFYTQTRVTLLGAAALIVFDIGNTDPVTQSIDVSLMIDLNVNGNDAAECVDFEGHSGFAAYGGNRARVNFFTKQHRLVTDASTYWFGPWFNRAANQWADSTYSSVSGVDTAMSLTWQNRSVPGGGRLVLSTLIVWGEGSTDPTLRIDSDLTDPVDLRAVFTIKGVAPHPGLSPTTIFAVVDDDLANLRILWRDVPAGDTFSLPLSFADYNVSIGRHFLDVYAVHITGTFSAPVRFETNVVLAPTKVVATRTRTYAPNIPLMTPPPGLAMVVDADTDANFRLRGENAEDVLEFAKAGFASRYFVSTGESGRLVALAPVSLDSLSIETRVIPIGASAIVAYEFTNFGTEPVSINLTLDVELTVAGPVIRTLDGGVGFRIDARFIMFRVFTANYPLVVDADAFWFGPAADRESHLWDQSPPGVVKGTDLAFAVSWQNRLVPPRGRTVLSAFLAWYDYDRQPNLNMAATQRPAVVEPRDTFSLAGTVSQGVRLGLVVDGDVGRILVMGGELKAGTAFSFSYTADELRLEAGSHALDVYAVALTGAASAPERFVIEVLAEAEPNRGRQEGEGDAGSGGPGLSLSVIAIATIVALVAVAVVGAVGYWAVRRKRQFAPEVSIVQDSVESVAPYTGLLG
jgi:hypothetical protein